MIYASGSNFFGQLGISDRVRPDPSTPIRFCDDLEADDVKDIQCGTTFTVALTASGKLSICGTLNGKVFPKLSPIVIPLPLKCIQIACGRKHIIALMERSIVLSWGVGYFGQLGNGEDNSVNSPKIVHQLDSARLGSPVKAVCSGGAHSGALTERGLLYMWGLNRAGQCGLNMKSDAVLEPQQVRQSGLDGLEIDKVVCGRNHSAVITSCGRVFVWGEVSFGRLGIPEVRKQQTSPVEIPMFRTTPARLIASGDFHMLALSRQDPTQIYAWGCGSDGQTGQSSLLNSRTPRRIEYFEKQQIPIEDITCGPTWSMVTSCDGQLFVFGCGDGGWFANSFEMYEGRTLPLVDLDNVAVNNPASGASVSHPAIQLFDSVLNVMRPTLLTFFSDRNLHVDRIRCGGGHAIVLCNSSNSGNRSSRSNVITVSPRSGRNGDVDSKLDSRSNDDTAVVSVAAESEKIDRIASAVYGEDSEFKRSPRSHSSTDNAADNGKADAKYTDKDLSFMLLSSGRSEFASPRNVPSARGGKRALTPVSSTSDHKKTAVMDPRDVTSTYSNNSGHRQADSKDSNSEDNSFKLEQSHGSTMSGKNNHTSMRQSPIDQQQQRLQDQQIQQLHVDNIYDDDFTAPSNNRDLGLLAFQSDSPASQRVVATSADRKVPNVAFSPMKVSVTDSHSFSSSSLSPMHRSPTNASTSARHSTADTNKSATVVTNIIDSSKSNNKQTTGKSSTYSVDEDLFMSWCRHKKLTEVVRALQECQVDVNFTDEAGNTPLIVACQNGHLPICQQLLKHGADVNRVNGKGNSALHYCFYYGYQRIGEYLIEHFGADEYITNHEGLTCYEGLTQSDLEII